MNAKKPKHLGLLMFSMVCACTQSLAEDVQDETFIARLALAKNSYVINRQGGVEIAPDLNKLAESAKENGKFEVVATALIADNRSEGYQLKGEFEQSCRVFPAEPFFEYVAEISKKDNTQPGLSFHMYTYLRSQENFSPSSFMTCSGSAIDRENWNKLVAFPSSQPFVFRGRTTNNGLRYFYVTHPSGTFFYF